MDVEDGDSPLYSSVRSSGLSNRRRSVLWCVGVVAVVLLVGAVIALAIATAALSSVTRNALASHTGECPYPSPVDRDEVYRKRERSEPGGSVLVKNAKLWRGTLDDDYFGEGLDVRVENGIITEVAAGLQAKEGEKVVDAAGAHVTPGIVDMHSHLGVYSLPFDGSGDADGNESSFPILPYVRAIDGLDPRDMAIDLIRGGGVTTSMVMPGSGEIMGGEGVFLKLQPFDSKGNREVHRMLIPNAPRALKFACGENPKNTFGSQGRMPDSRLGEGWLFRSAFEEAYRAMVEQDHAQCLLSNDIQVDTQEADMRKHEPLIALMRTNLETDAPENQVRAQVHCYKVEDMEAVLRTADAYGWKVSAFHHAMSAWRLADELAARNITSAIFASHGLFKLEGYDFNPAAPQILNEAGASFAFKSDHPILFARYLYRQAAVGATLSGISDKVAVAAITSVPAHAMGLGHRVGSVLVGYEGDLVVWTGSPLSTATRAKTVIIDGHVVDDFPHPALPPLPTVNGERIAPTNCPEQSEVIAITNVAVFTLDDKQNQPLQQQNIVIQNNVISCVGDATACPVPQGAALYSFRGSAVVAPGFTSVGPDLCQTEVPAERNAGDGSARDSALSANIRAIDGVLPHMSGSKHAALGWGSGILQAIVAPAGGLVRGVGCAFHLKGDLFDDDAIISQQLSLDLNFGNAAKATYTSVSEQMAQLRTLFASSTAQAVADAKAGTIPVVVRADARDHIAALLRLREEFALRLVVVGGAEAHLLANQIAAAGPGKVGVVLSPYFPAAFEELNSVENAFQILTQAGVTTALTSDMFNPDRVTLLRFLAGFQRAFVSDVEALKAITKNIAVLFGLEGAGTGPSGTIEVGKAANLVVWSGNPLESRSRPLLNVLGNNKAYCDPPLI